MRIRYNDTIKKKEKEIYVKYTGVQARFPQSWGNQKYMFYSENPYVNRKATIALIPEGLYKLVVSKMPNVFTVVTVNEYNEYINANISKAVKEEIKMSENFKINANVLDKKKKQKE